MRIRFWQNIISPHQYEVFVHLASMFQNEVSLVVSDAMHSERLKLGWTEPEIPGVAIVREPSIIEIEQLFDEPQDVEIFSAPWGNTLLHKAFLCAISRSVKVGMMSEPGDWRGFKGLLRVLRGRMHKCMYENRFSFILAIGCLAQIWFKKCGYGNEKIFPYTYTTKVEKLVNRTTDRLGKMRIVYTGQLIHRKGVNRLLTALAELKRYDWELQIIGSGILEKYWRMLVEIYLLEDRVHFRGAVKNNLMSEILGNSDLLVLPSYWDGWGAVVNEALHQGIPVICSDRCGAQSLIRNERNGMVFDSRSSTDLKRKMEYVMSRRNEIFDDRISITKHADRFSGKSVAKYLQKVIRYSLFGEGNHPIPPWQLMKDV